jgi:hypothetical protein
MTITEDDVSVPALKFTTAYGTVPLVSIVTEYGVPSMLIVIVLEPVISLLNTANAPASSYPPPPVKVIVS